MITSSELIKLVLQRNPSAKVDTLRKAYMYAMEAHGSQKRSSGPPYFYHPAEVARILAEIGMDVPTIATGLLHDVLEDTNTSFEELEELFGSEIASLVRGVTKLSSVKYSSREEYQADNIRKFLLAISRDLRILIVKIVDRLHNMRTLHYVSQERQKNIALETLDIYAPLAEKIGMNPIKEEMEDIAFYVLYPNEYSFLEERLNQILSKDEDFVPKTIKELQNVLHKAGIDAEVQGRTKRTYSIWKKMQRRNVTFEQINDIVAFRIIVKTVDQCYLSLGVIHTNFLIVPGRFKDYISVPKLNGYKSLHTTVIGPSKQKIEIQIRTEEMHQICENGNAAHYSYKNSELEANAEDAKNYAWITNLMDAVKASNTPEEIMENAKLEMFPDKVFCFTPDGKLIKLPRGATAIDFAYEVHTDIGNTCTGVQINGKIADFRTVLKNGDQVNIITSPQQVPDPAWERFVVTGKAKSCIKKYIRNKSRSEFTELGSQLVTNIFSAYGVPFSEDVLNYKKFGYSSLDNFLYNVGKGVVSLNRVRMNISSVSSHQIVAREKPLILEKFTIGIAVHFSDCCTPIIGDKIVGVFAPQRGVVVHLSNCSNLSNEKEFISIKWHENEEGNSAFVARLRIVIANQKDSFAMITNIISSAGASITNLKVEYRSANLFDLLVDIKTDNLVLLGEIQASLRICSNVRLVQRL
ncbi:MAG: bifunctional (p)ppGpp synthetase/guanosine-3',5'-bis(diphosphate) 3'-pyrophosphohydrolase [Alphaproteobacteria bacterium]|nr:bifunctional (p)ppGpp synthetase/guanosine-3',5'-bis(diphosphate) 3'-pyrophosphohydrolase [Alphaproteobacteria bacterium]